MEPSAPQPSNGQGPQQRLEAHHQSKTWSIEDSERLYNLQGWGEPYFSINAAGHVTVSPKGDRGGAIDLLQLVESLKQRQLKLPILIRFPDILEDRIKRLHACFARAIARYAYPGSYQGVFPIKCNQQHPLVKDVVRFGAPYQFGLEAGSKPELMIALATLDTPGAFLICNGYKDQEYVETALLAQRLGHRTILVLEQPSDLTLVLDASDRLQIQPLLGVRAKLNVKGSGRWAATTGDRAKFGLTIPEIMQVVDRLRSHSICSSSALDCLQLLHFHIGSQISSIGLIKDALREASQIYVELIRLGAPMQFLNVGGGLAVDYDGSKTNSPASKNYNMQNYANDVVAAVKDACEEGQVPVPTLMSESGRAIASHQSILVFDVLGTSGILELAESSHPVDEDPPSPLNVSPGLLSVRPIAPPSPLSPLGPSFRATPGPKPLVLRNLRDAYESITPEHYQEAYHDALQFKQEALSLFKLGYLSMADRAQAEELYWACCRRIRQVAATQDYGSEDIAELDVMMASIYYINLSVFQSIPDTWAIGQLFPIMPIHRLETPPSRQAMLADLTCDSDGTISQFIHRQGSAFNGTTSHGAAPDGSASHGATSLLPLHSFQPNRPYYLGLFLGGAYQDIMGNLHNLFGKTHVVHICLTTKGYRIADMIQGNTIADVLSAAQYDTNDLLETLRGRTEQALQSQQITSNEAQLLLQNYGRSLQNYTYLTMDFSGPNGSMGLKNHP